MDAMVAAGRHATQFLYLVELIIPIRVRYSVQAAFHLALVVVDPDVERIEGPQQTIGCPNLGRHLLDVLGLQGLTDGRCGETV